MQVAEDGVPNKEGTLEMLAPLKETDTDMYDKMVKVFETCTASCKYKLYYYTNFKVKIQLKRSNLSFSVEKNDDPCISSTKWAECGIREGKAVSISSLIF